MEAQLCPISFILWGYGKDFIMTTSVLGSVGISTSFTDNTSSIFSAMSSTAAQQSLSNTMLNNGLSFLQDGKYQQAVNAFRMSVSYNADNGTGNNTTAYNYMAQAYESLGNDKQAITAYQQSLQLDTTQDTIHVALANIYIKNQQNAAAETQLKAAMTANPSNYVAPYTLGQLLTTLGQPAEAEQYFRQTIKLDSNDGNAYYGLGLSLDQQGKASDAIPVLQKAVDLNPSSEAAQYELGNAYYKNGQTDLAQNQVTALQALGTTTGTTYATELSDALSKPKFVTIDTVKSTFNTMLGSVPLMALDPGFVQPGSSEQMSATFLFSSTMDTKSVMDVSNWNISKAQGAKINLNTGLYENGAYLSTDTTISPVPDRVMYDSSANEATVFFTVGQNADATGTIDASKLIFTFNGTDVNGKQMDTTGNQIDGFSNTAF